MCAQSRPKLCHPMDCNLPGFSVHGIIQARILEWGAISSSRGSSWSRDWTRIFCIGKRVLYHYTTWEWINTYKTLPGQGHVSERNACCWPLRKANCLPQRWIKVSYKFSVCNCFFFLHHWKPWNKWKYFDIVYINFMVDTSLNLLSQWHGEKRGLWKMYWQVIN